MLAFSRMNAADHYKKVCEDIQEIALKCGRNPSEITLVAVTKQVPWSDVLPVYQAGCRHFGENRLQEVLPKQAESSEDVTWHFIGTLQKNKVRKVIERFSLIHSVDTPELAKKISESSLQEELITKVLLQINTSGERSKHGLSSEQWLEAFEEVGQLKGIEIHGLMTMAPYIEETATIHQCFARLRDMRSQLQKHLHHPQPFLHLSMGMSHDYPIAIQEGATLLRIGSAIFSSDSNFF